MRYPVVIHKDPTTDFGITVPDLPGCFSAGSTIDEALANAIEAIELHLEGMLSDNEAILQPQKLEVHQTHPDYAGGTWKTVKVDLAKLKRAHQKPKVHTVGAAGA